MSGSLITCPQCDGMGLDIIDGEAAPCWLSGYNGYIELPVTAEQADYIYSKCLPESRPGALVSQTWDREGDTECPECTILRRCDDCYTEMVSW